MEKETVIVHHVGRNMLRMTVFMIKPVAEVLEFGLIAESSEMELTNRKKYYILVVNCRFRLNCIFRRISKAAVKLHDNSITSVNVVCAHLRGTLRS